MNVADLGLVDLDRDLDEVAQRIDAAARDAYQRYLELVDQGVSPRSAVERIKGGFDTRYYGELSQAFDRIAAEPWTVKQLRDYPVSGVTLSKRLHQHWQVTGNRVATITARHAKGLHQARALALELYDGYGHRSAELLQGLTNSSHLPAALRELAREPQIRNVLTLFNQRAAAVRLRTASLRSAYLQAFESALTGASKAELGKMLRVAMEEKTRYFANRIAQTELARAYSDRIAAELMADPTIEAVQWRLSAAHPVDDICDLFAHVDRYGLGPGVYPKRLAPKPIAHPFCRCRLRSRPDLNGEKWRDNPAAEAGYLRQFDEKGAARIMGSRQRLEAVLNGQEARTIWNAGRPIGYQVVPLGSALPAPGRSRRTTKAKATPVAALEPPAPPVNPYALPAFKPAKTVAEAARYAEELINAPGPRAYPLLSSGEAAVRFRHSTGLPSATRAKLLGRATYAGLDVETANFINRWLLMAQAECDRLGIPRLRGINTSPGRGAAASMGDGVLAIAKRGNSVRPPSAFMLEARRRDLARYEGWRAVDGNTTSPSADLSKSVRSRPHTTSNYWVDDEDRLTSTLWHEFAHHVHQQMNVRSLQEYATPPLEAVLARSFHNVPAFPTVYSTRNSKEFFAECFSLWRMGRSDLVPDFMVRILETVDKGLVP